MVDRHPSNNIRIGASPAVLATAALLLIVSAAGAADRVVLGEYFTNLY